MRKFPENTKLKPHFHLPVFIDRYAAVKPMKVSSNMSNIHTDIKQFLNN